MEDDVTMTGPVDGERARIGVIGGSGLYRLFEDGSADEIDVDTPFGPTSSPISIGTMAGKRVAFLTRHGREHSVAPHRINHRANLWALRSLGVRALVSSSAVGGLHPDYAPGTFVVTDQLIDRTWGRADTFFEDAVQHCPSPTRSIPCSAASRSRPSARSTCRSARPAPAS